MSVVVKKREGIPNNKVEVIIEKNRSGARGTVELIFKKNTINFQVSQEGGIRCQMHLQM